MTLHNNLSSITQQDRYHRKILLVMRLSRSIPKFRFLNSIGPPGYPNDASLQPLQHINNSDEEKLKPYPSPHIKIRMKAACLMNSNRNISIQHVEIFIKCQPEAYNWRARSIIRRRELKLVAVCNIEPKAIISKKKKYMLSQANNHQWLRLRNLIKKSR